MPGSSATPRAVAIVFWMSAGSRTGARSTNHVPPGKRSATVAASASASRVLPVPPGPPRVSSRVAPMASRERREFGLAPDEVGRWCRQVRRGVDGPQRPTVVRGARHDQQMERPRDLEVLQPARADLDELRAVRQSTGQGVARLLRQRDLAAVGGRRHARGVVDVDADVVGARVGQPALARVDTDAHARPLSILVVAKSCQRTREGDGGCDGVGRVAECGEHAVALVLDDRATDGGHGRLDQAVVLAEEGRPGVRAERVGEPRRGLDVGEEERHRGAGRQAHRSTLHRPSSMHAGARRPLRRG